MAFETNLILKSLLILVTITYIKSEYKKRRNYTIFYKILTTIKIQRKKLKQRALYKENS